VLHNEIVILQMWVGAANAIELITLSGAELLVWIETPDSFEQALSAQDFMNASDAAGESIRDIENRGVCVSDFDGEPEHFNWNGRGTLRKTAAFCVQFDCLSGPDCPLAQQAANDAPLDCCSFDLEAEWS